MAKARKEDRITPWGEHISTRPRPWELGKPRRYYDVTTDDGTNMLGLNNDELATVSSTNIPVTKVEGNIHIRPTLPGIIKAQKDAKKIVALVPDHASGFLIGKGHRRSSFHHFTADGFSK